MPPCAETGWSFDLLDTKPNADKMGARKPFSRARAYGRGVCQEGEFTIRRRSVVFAKSGQLPCLVASHSGSWRSRTTRLGRADSKTASKIAHRRHPHRNRILLKLQ